MTFRADIQILRGLAVLLVVLFHLDLAFFSRGFLGVDIFFVISGFLMAQLYRPGEARNFYQRRAARLLPAYFATVAATIIISALVTLPSEHGQVVTQGLFASTFMPNIGFWLQNSYFSKEDFNPTLHLWSLGVEFQFYLILPALFWLRRKSLPLIAALAIGSLLSCLLLVTISPKTAFFLLPFRLWEFLSGAGVAWLLTNHGQPQKPMPLLGVSGFLALALLAMAAPIDGEMPSLLFGHPALAAVLVVIATCLVLVFGLPDWLMQSYPSAALQKIGDWSYSLYLAHFPVITLFLYSPFSGTTLSTEHWIVTATLIALISAASAILFILFDRRRCYSLGFQRTGLICAALTVLSIGSGPVNRMRFSTEDQAITGAVSDRASYRCGKVVRLIDPVALLCEITTGLPKSAPSLVLIGDSHADAIRISFASEAERAGYRLHFTASNSPIIAAPDGLSLLAEINRHQADGVILHFNASNTLHALDSGFHIEALRSGLSVTWLLPIPTYEESVPKVIWQRRVTHSWSEFEPIDSPATQIIKDRLSGSAVQMLDTHAAFCGQNCLLADDEMHPYYFDRSHLTLRGAALLKPVMAEAIEYHKTH